MFNRFFILLLMVVILTACNPRVGNGLRRNDLSKDVEMLTDKGTMVIRLSDLTPLHRNNFLHLVKTHFYDSIPFHRVINHFMIQAGDPKSRPAGKNPSSDTTSYTLPAEFNETLFHSKGVIAAARMGDDTNPTKASSGTQFYIVQGKTFTDAGLDSVETFRLKKKLPAAHRAVYKTVGGAPHLDGNYTVFGQVISGLATVDSVAVVATSGKQGNDRPLQNVRIISAKLIKRK